MADTTFSSGTVITSNWLNDVNKVVYRTYVDTINSLTTLPTANFLNNDVVLVKGYYAAGDGGGGYFLWNSNSTDTAITGMIIGSGTGRWIRIFDGQINDRMCGAKIDNATFDDAALTAMASYVTYNPLCRRLAFLPGSRKVLQTGGASTTPFSISGVDGLTIHFESCTFNTTRTNAETNVALFSFSNCKGLTFIGRPKITGPLTKAQIAAMSSGAGSIGVALYGNCSNMKIAVDGVGLLEPVLLNRAPRVMLDSSIAPFIGAGGSGYTVGNVLTLSDIGSTATTAATLTVTSVNAGAITGLSVTTPGIWPNFFDGTIAGSSTGFSVTGGSGTGAKVCPYTVDYDDATTSDMTRGGVIDVTADTCYYGVNGQFNGSDLDVRIEANLVYRAFFFYSVQGIRARLRIRDQRMNSVLACVMGIPTSGDFDIQVLPAIEPGFCPGGTVLVGAFYGANSGRLRMNTTWDAKRTGGTDCGQYLKIEKYAAGADDANPRGHYLWLTIGGKFDGHGVNDSGVGSNIAGLNVNYTDASWFGDKIDVHLRDGLTTINCSGWGFALNARALSRLTVGKVNLDCNIRLDPQNTGIRLNPAGPVVVDRDATFSNRFSDLGDINVTASYTVPANLPNARFNHATAGINIIASLPPSVAGAQFTFWNNTGAGSSHYIDPNGTEQIGDGVTFGAAGKQLRLTGLGAMATLRCFAAGIWTVVSVAGTYSFEP